MVELVNHCLANGIMTDRILKAAVRCQVRRLWLSVVCDMDR
jgi:hypothetical protein